MDLLLLLIFGPAVYAALQASAMKNAIDVHKELGLPLDDLREQLQKPQAPEREQEWAVVYDSNQAPIQDWLDRHRDRSWFKVASLLKLVR
ncbi:MAG TPA: hypothetical protein VH157_07080 [Bryobacteraceae bacterium]|jgi:DNA-binding transcriptional MerR regulator|nr:hypothetical protein [Bryobacteraceae bacterium]